MRLSRPGGKFGPAKKAPPAIVAVPQSEEQRRAAAVLAETLTNNVRMMLCAALVRSPCSDPFPFGTILAAMCIVLHMSWVDWV